MIFDLISNVISFLPEVIWQKKTVHISMNRPKYQTRLLLNILV